MIFAVAVELGPLCSELSIIGDLVFFEGNLPERLAPKKALDARLQSPRSTRSSGVSALSYGGLTLMFPVGDYWLRCIAHVFRLLVLRGQ